MDDAEIEQLLTRPDVLPVDVRQRLGLKHDEAPCAF
jgi:hypothetical protein